jgi:hypothetical protein
MRNSDASDLLKQLIQIKEGENKAEGELLKEHFYASYESLKPLNVVKKMVGDIFSSPEINNNIVNATLGLITGFLAKKVVVRTSTNPITKLAGTLIELLVASNVAANADEIRAVARVMLKKVLPQEKAEAA